MRTVIVTGFPVAYALPLMLAFVFIGKCLTFRVSAFFREITFHCRRNDPVITTAIWLFSVTSVLALMSPASLLDRAFVVLMLGFLLQSGVTDAISGYLPITFTGRFLAAGLFTGMICNETSTFYWLDTVEMGFLMVMVNTFINHKTQRIGQGDLWLITGLTAWTGLQNTALVSLVSLVFFLLWQSTWQLNGKKEGPLGPWICITAGFFQLSHLYQPVWVEY